MPGRRASAVVPGAGEVIKSIGDANTRALSVEKGDINFTVDPPFNEFDRLSKKKGIIEDRKSVV